MDNIVTATYAVIKNETFGTRAYVNSIEGREMLRQDLENIDRQTLSNILDVWGDTTTVEEPVYPETEENNITIFQRLSDLEDAIAELAFGGEV